MSMKNSNESIGNQTRDLQACIATTYPQIYMYLHVICLQANCELFGHPCYIYQHFICLLTNCERCGQPCYKVPDIDSVVKQHKAFRCSNCYKHHAARSPLVSSPHLTLDTCSLCYSIACKVPLQVFGFEQVIVFPAEAQHLITRGELTVSETEDEALCKYTKSHKGILTMPSVSSKIGR
jgi:hypothetical protein